MTRRCMAVAVAFWLAASAMVWADSIKTTSASLSGKITKVSAMEVTIEPAAGGAKQVPVNEIEMVVYEDEPTLLKTARTAAAAGRFEDALTALEKVNAAEIKRPEVKQDLDFLKAYAAAKLALAGNGKITEAGSAMASFASANPESFHSLEAAEIVGDLLVAAGKHSAAQTFYAKVAEAPWPDYKMRAKVAIGRALMAEGKSEEAMKAFQEALNTEAQGELADRQRLAATLGTARCLIQAGKAEESIKAVQAVIEKADPEAMELHAKAYNVLGLAHRKANRPKDALMAFLHTDVLYFTNPEDHVEALKNLAELWKELQKPDRAARAEQILRDQYKQGG
ncbi:MAG: tetratricopeptide repeat protein [Pirellulales bacterium]|nr:tetratricopeptide repeat protein [Pirellulales bacterium]